MKAKLTQLLLALVYTGCGVYAGNSIPDEEEDIGQDKNGGGEETQRFPEVEKAQSKTQPLEESLEEASPDHVEMPANDAANDHTATSNTKPATDAMEPTKAGAPQPSEEECPKRVIRTVTDQKQSGIEIDPRIDKEVWILLPGKSAKQTDAFIHVEAVGEAKISWRESGDIVCHQTFPISQEEIDAKTLWRIE